MAPAAQRLRILLTARAVSRLSRAQVDSYYCPHCLDEHMPSTEAKLNRQRSRCAMPSAADMRQMHALLRLPDLHQHAEHRAARDRRCACVMDSPQ